MNKKIIQMTIIGLFMYLSNSYSMESMDGNPTTTNDDNTRLLGALRICLGKIDKTGNHLPLGSFSINESNLARRRRESSRRRDKSPITPDFSTAQDLSNEMNKESQRKDLIFYISNKTEKKHFLLIQYEDKDFTLEIKPLVELTLNLKIPSDSESETIKLKSLDNDIFLDVTIFSKTKIVINQNKTDFFFQIINTI